jgi:UDP-glucose 4-epimerase
MRILVTGASGFLGKYLVRMLAKRHEVIATSPRPLPSEMAEIRHIQIDFSAAWNREALPAMVDCIVHLAQSPHYRNFPAAAQHIAATNLTSTAELLAYAQAVGAQHFVLASTGGVYPMPTTAMDEKLPIRPCGYYAVTKYASELLAGEYAAWMNICVLRCFFLYGPDQQADRLVPSLFEKVRSGEDIYLDGHQNGMIFTPTYIEDAAAIFERSIEDRWSGIFNLAAPTTIDLRSFATLIGERLDRTPRFSIRPEKPHIVYKPILTELSRKLDISILRSAAEGLDEMVERGNRRNEAQSETEAR